MAPAIFSMPMRCAAIAAGRRAARLFSLATDNDAMLALLAAAIDAFADDPTGGSAC
jgi:hypothetical protein